MEQETVKTSMTIDLLRRAIGVPLRIEVFEKCYEEALNHLKAGHHVDAYGLKIQSPPGVYPPIEGSSTRFVLDHWADVNLGEVAGKTFLEVGCGTGMLSIYAARKGAIVTACDICPLAIQATNANAQLNEVRVRVVQSDLLSSLRGEKFDVIVFNHPLFHVFGRTIESHEKAHSCKDGELFSRFLGEASEALSQGGWLVTSFANCSHDALLCHANWNFDIAAFDWFGGQNYLRMLLVGRKIKAGSTDVASTRC